MKSTKIVTANTETVANNRTLISSVNRGNNWTGSITSNSGSVRVKVNSVSGLFSRSEQFGNIKKKG